MNLTERTTQLENATTQLENAASWLSARLGVTFEPAEDEPAEDEPAEDEPAEDEPAEDEPAEAIQKWTVNGPLKEAEEAIQKDRSRRRKKLFFKC